MKKLFLFPLLCLSLLFSACGSGDDDDQPKTEPDTENLVASMIQRWIDKDTGHNTIGASLSDYMELQGNKKLFFEVSNPQVVTSGNAQSPTLEIKETMFLFAVYTYHWDYIRTNPAKSAVVYSWLEDAAGKQYGRTSPTTWQYGQGNKEKACWYTFPLATLQPGTYTVKCSSEATWSHNAQSENLGFCGVWLLPTGAK